MKAAVYKKYGPPEDLQIQEIEKPVPQENEVLVKIHATTVTSGDFRMRKADPFISRFMNGLTKPKKWQILGSEFSGVIESTGENVTRSKAGDQVMGSTDMNLGANAEYVCLPENGTFILKPTKLSFEETAPLTFGGNTAWHFLNKANIRKGQKVLIYGASGAIGTFAVQLAKHLGAEVTGICSTGNMELVKSLGADNVIDYTQEDFTLNGKTYDVIFDTVGKSPFSDCVKSLAKEGYYLRAVHMTIAPLLKGLWVSLTSSKKVIGGIALVKNDDLEYLKDLLDKGIIKPVIDKVYPLEKISDAHSYAEKGHKKGNVVLTLNK